MVVVISGVYKFYKSVIMIPTRNIISQLKSLVNENQNNNGVNLTD